VLIAGGSGPIISVLTENLSFQNLKVVRDNDEKPNYIFDFTSNNELKKNGAKYLQVNLEERPGALIGESVYQLTKAMFGTEGLESIIVGIPEVPKPEVVTPVVIKPKKNKKLLILIPIAILFIFVLFPIISLFANGFSGVQALRTAKDKALTVDFVGAQISAASAENSFIKARDNLRQIAPLFKIVYLSEVINNFDRFLSLAERGAQVGTSVSQAANNILAANYSQAGNDLFQASINFGFIEAQLTNPKTRQLFVSQEKYLAYLPQARSILTFGQEILPYVPELLGQSGRKSYLVLFQNNAELRPSGGFIGAYAIVDFENGKLLSYKINDIYTADGQLRGKVNPPDEILHFLGQPDWFMRDSNFSPDFPLSAKRAAWFLEKSTGQKVDGVIGIDMYVIQKLLKNFGPLVLSDFNETVTADNFFEKAESQAEIDFFPGSTKKKDYLTAVGQALFEKLTLNDKVARAIFESLNERHLQIYFNDPPAQEALSRQDWSGDLKFTGDNYLGLSEANFGANKSNYYVKREIFLQEDIAKTGEVDTTVTINYQNTSLGEAWPGGRYKNYLRLYVPLSAQFLSASLGDTRKATVSAILTENVLKKINSDEFLIYKSTESGNLNFGMLVEISPNSKKTVSFSYRMPRIDFTTGLQKIFVRKQAGTDADKLTVIANGPLIKYNTVTDLLTDRNFDITWKKQL
ncbi:MAG: DUF4012 domain-containing protein, partial [bacterium]|nr:DUF4012 domain-containing protein [bacterium]